MYYENDAQVLAWFERAARSPSSLIRMRVAELLESVDCRQRTRWLETLSHDESEQVVDAARATIAALHKRDPRFDADLLASDFMSQLDATEFVWEWEYAVLLCTDSWIPVVPARVWLRLEDDETARQMARMLIGARPGLSQAACAAIIVDKRPVNRYTKSSGHGRRTKSA